MFHNTQRWCTVCFFSCEHGSMGELGTANNNRRDEDIYFQDAEEAARVTHADLRRGSSGVRWTGPNETIDVSIGGGWHRGRYESNTLLELLHCTALHCTVDVVVQTNRRHNKKNNGHNSQHVRCTTI